MSFVDFIQTPRFMILLVWGLAGMVAVKDVGKRYGWGAAWLLYSIYIGLCPVFRS